MTKCHTCAGDGEIEVCSSCSNEVENCECETESPTENEECPDCEGDGEIDDDETEEED